MPSSAAGNAYGWHFVDACRLLSFLQVLRDNETASEQHRNLAEACLKAYKYDSLPPT